MKDDHPHPDIRANDSPSTMRGMTLSEKRGRFELYARVDEMGPDLLVTLWGGAVHIGALGMAVPRPSLRDPNEKSATSSVFTFPGHKEDMTVKLVSEGLSGRLGRNVVVVAGIHWDALKPEEIREIMEASEALMGRIVLELKKA
ncbi:MAG: hypothetical protein ABSC19_09540 [Syntrophorhabdales bacterium]|jgi:hypothetical protein